MTDPMIPQSMLIFATDNSRFRFSVEFCEAGSKYWSRKRIATLSVASRERMYPVSASDQLYRLLVHGRRRYLALKAAWFRKLTARHIWTVWLWSSSAMRDFSELKISSLKLFLVR